MSTEANHLLPRLGGGGLINKALRQKAMGLIADTINPFFPRVPASRGSRGIRYHYKVYAFKQEILHPLSQQVHWELLHRTVRDDIPKVMLGDG